MEKVAAIILSRIDSNRLPGKALKKIGGKTLIQRTIDRVKAKNDFVPIIATTNREIDKPLINVAEENGILHFKGSLENVAKRVKDCIIHYGFEYFARLNADSPFVPIELLDTAKNKIVNSKYDFITNLLPRTFPYGISVEMFNSKSFIQGMSYYNGINKYEEHISSYFYENKENYNYLNLFNDNLKLEDELSGLRLVVDTQEDFNTLEKVYQFDNNLFDLSTQIIIKKFLHLKNNNKI